MLHKIGVLEDCSSSRRRLADPADLRVADPVEGVDEDTKNVWFEWSYGEQAEYDRICMTKVDGKHVPGSGSGLTRCAAVLRLG